jgi:esterase
VQLHYHSYGSESLPALIILHGLLGSSDNWHSFGIKFGERFHTLALDARNHGKSPHSDVFDYPSMAADVVEFMSQQNIRAASVLGHSMGGKTAALAALLYPDTVDKLIVVDIAPRSYRDRNDQIFGALHSIDVNAFSFRKDIDTALSATISDFGIRQFLMKNLGRNESGRFYWKMNLEAIEKNYDRINEELPRARQFDKPALFIRGGRSEHIRQSDFPLIRELFPAAQIATIKNAGHWIHADAPEEFFSRVMEFLTAS